MGPKKSSRERGELSESSSAAGVGVVVDGEFMPIGTMPTSSGRSEGEGVESVGPEESDVAVRRLTASELVCAEAEELNIRAINKKPPQMEGLFIKKGVSDFRICKPSQPLLRSYKRLLFGRQPLLQEGLACKEL